MFAETLAEPLEGRGRRLVRRGPGDLQLVSDLGEGALAAWREDAHPEPRANREPLASRQPRDDGPDLLAALRRFERFMDVDDGARFALALGVEIDVDGAAFMVPALRRATVARGVDCDPIEPGSERRRVPERPELPAKPERDVLDDLGGLRVVAADLLERDRLDKSRVPLEDVGDFGPLGLVEC